MLIKNVNYNMLILGELQRLEDLSSEYKAILILISKRIRRDLWQWLYKLLVNNVVKNFVYYKPMK